MPCNSNQSKFRLCTDASYYTPNATTIDVTASFTGGGVDNGKGGFIAPTWDYDFDIQRKNGDSWTTYTSHTKSGYFKNASPVKSFKLNVLQSGTYRIRMKYSAREVSNSGSVYTISFSVTR